MTPPPQYSHLLPPTWKTQIASWLEEDTPSFDYGGFVVGEAPRDAFLLGKGSKRAILAGVPFVNEIFRLLDCTYVHVTRIRQFTHNERLLMSVPLDTPLDPQGRVARHGRRRVRTRQARCNCARQGTLFAPRRARCP